MKRITNSTRNCKFSQHFRTTEAKNSESTLEFFSKIVPTTMYFQYSFNFDFTDPLHFTISAKNQIHRFRHSEEKVFSHRRKSLNKITMKMLSSKLVTNIFSTIYLIIFNFRNFTKAFTRISTPWISFYISTIYLFWLIFLQICSDSNTLKKKFDTLSDLIPDCFFCKIFLLPEAMSSKLHF